MSAEKKLILPNLNDVASFSEFLAEFVKANKAAHRYFSHRWLAKKLEWPLSYCADVIAKRKPITMTRALEFAQFLKLDNLLVERLVLLALSESPTDVVKQFALKLTSSYSIPEAQNPNVVSEVKHDVDLFLLNELLAHWMASRGGPGFSESITKICPALSLDAEQIDRKLKEMVRLKMIVVHEDGSISPGENQGGLTARGTILEFREIHSQYAAYLLRYLQSATCLSPAFGAFLRLPESRIVEAQSKFAQVFNWFVHICQEYDAEAARNGPASDEQVFQFMFYLLPLLKPLEKKVT